MKKIAELQQERVKLMEQRRALLNKCEAENRQLNTEEDVEYRKMADASAALLTQINRLKEIEIEENELRASEGASEAARENAENRTTPEAGERRAAFAKYLRDGQQALNRTELRALQVDSDTAGGYLVPRELVAGIIKGMDNLTYIRAPGRATIIQATTAGSLGQGTLDTDPEDATWTSEIGEADEDTAMAFGARELNPHNLTKLVKISEQLIRKTANSIETLVQERLSYKFAVTQENVFLNGTGAQQPLGVMVASSQGVSTSRDVSTGNTDSLIKPDNLKAAKMSLKPQYRNESEWMFSTEAVLQIEQMKDGIGQYLLQPAIKDDTPMRLLGRPMLESVYMPNTFTTGLYVGLLCVWRYYHIAESLAMRIQRAGELYLRTNQVGYFGRMELDGMPVLEEAFARVKLA